MIYISHRGNLYGPNPERENSPAYIQEAIEQEFHVEIDLRMLNGIPHLGHDFPEYPVSEQWLLERKDYLWIHAKEYASLQWVHARQGLIYFCHEHDTYTLVSNGKIWCHDWKNEMNEHCVLPLITKASVESYNYLHHTLYAVCSDYLFDCKEKFN